MLTHILEGVQPWHMQKDSRFNFIVGKVQHSMIAGLVLCDVKETKLNGICICSLCVLSTKFQTN